jgi:hypothetical protein
MVPRLCFHARQPKFHDQIGLGMLSGRSGRQVLRPLEVKDFVAVIEKESTTQRQVRNERGTLSAAHLRTSCLTILDRSC